MIEGSRIFICGTDTGIGKTVVSACLVKALQADYWKPIQCGDLDSRDRYTVQKLVGNSDAHTFHPESLALQNPESPHLAAEKEGVYIRTRDFRLPKTSRTLVIESAGGCLSPLSDKESVIDLAKAFEVPVVLVTKFYLGAYNHSLLSFEAIQKRETPILGFILNGGDQKDFRKFLEHKTGVPCLAVLEELPTLSEASCTEAIRHWRQPL